MKDVAIEAALEVPQQAFESRWTKVRAYSLYPLDRMNVGDSFCFPVKNILTVQSAYRGYQMHIGKINAKNKRQREIPQFFLTRESQKEWRVWRIQ